ncbi:MAG: hypothetical protein L0Z71_17195 [Anaerolineae bacterium]|nr:hypothetical protein [Anaerolineae bacterium]
MKKTTICFACNEDGVGPSSFAYYLVQAITETWKKSGLENALEIRVLISNEIAYEFNRSIYSSDKFFGIVRLSDADPQKRKKIDSLIRLYHKNGEVNVPNTITAWRKYGEWKETYCQNVKKYLEGSCVAVDIGVPLFARCAKNMGIPNITFFDHSWSCTLRGISSRDTEYIEDIPSDEQREEAGKIALEIEDDERCSSDILLFDHYITPPEFYQHWIKLGFTPKTIGGVLGYRRDPATALKILNNLFVEFGQERISAQQKMVLISPGGTPIWNQLIPRMVNAFDKMPRGDYMPVLSLPNPAILSKAEMTKIVSSKGIRLIGPVRGATNQAIMPAFDLVVTRAGGGTVNDCLAAETSFVCIEQRQWQVKLIERECKIHQPPLIPSFEETRFDVFKEHPADCIDKFFAYTPRIDPGIKTSVEKDVAELILSWCK